ncbi:MAG: hypothetical protein ACRD2R_04935, partial [Terriglobales bacterium]
MAFDARRLRVGFALAALMVLLVVAGFYARVRLASREVAARLPQGLGVDVQQSTEGFTLSKSEGGRTLFTVRASRAVQFKSGGRAQLQEVQIVVRGRRSDRFDQIYGSDFEYDPATGDVTAHGEVHIDLETDEEGPRRPDQTVPRELKNPVYLKTSGLVFNQKTGIAKTREPIEFRIPQASGSAVGARYDSAASVLDLESSIAVRLTHPAGVAITAERAALHKDPRRAELFGVRLEQDANRLRADQLTVFLREDNSVERILAEGNVTASAGGPRQTVLVTPRAEILFEPRGELRSAVLSQGVRLDAAGPRPMHAESGELVLQFAAENRLEKVRALKEVRLSQRPPRGAGRAQGVELTAHEVEFLLREGKALERAITTGPAQVTLTPPESTPTAPTTRVTAAHLEASFGPRNRLQSLRGPDAEIAATSPGVPDRVSQSHALEVRFAASGPAAIASIRQHGDVQYSEGQRSARAEDALYDPASGELVLTGAPRFAEGALLTTAHTLRLNRLTSE